MMKRFSRTVLASVATVSTVLVSLAATDFFVLSSRPVSAQQVSRGNGYVSIQLPSTGNQDDNWSCGPNSAARVLAFYGQNVDYNAVRSAVNQEFMLPPSVNVPAPTWTDPLKTRRVDIRTGTTPHVLRNVMKQWEGENIKLERKADFTALKRVLNEGKPVVALLRVGSIDTVVSGTWPAMHWVAVNGFNESKRLISITDTDGIVDDLTYDDFLKQWDWSVGRGFASESLSRNGVQSRTMIWVDRVAERVNPSNPCPHGGRVAGANCKIYAFKNPVIVVPGVKYWVSVEYAGVYYKPVDKLCPYGGGRVGANCKLIALDSLLTKGIEYWVDTTIQYPGVYYRQSR